MIRYLMPVFALLLAIATPIGMVAWLSAINPREPAVSWGLRIGSASIFSVSLIGLFVLASLPEEVPDFLSRLGKPRMGRESVLFVFDCAARGGWAWIDIHYQSRFTTPAKVVVALAPSPDFLLSRNQIDPVLVQFDCGAAAYGVVRVPIAVRFKYQGYPQLFDVTSRSHFPSGMGKCLRNAVGPAISQLNFSFVDSSAATLARLAITGNLLGVKSQSRVKLMLPRGVAESSANLPEIIQEEIWSLANQQPEGDPASTS